MHNPVASARAMRDPASRPSSARFVDLTCVYQRYVQSGPPVTSFDESPSALACSCDESSMRHPVAIHHDHHHIHPMVTRRSTCVIRLVDRLVLTADTALAPSLIPSIHIALADPHGRRAMEYVPLLANHTKDFKEPCPPGTNMVTGKWIFYYKLKVDGTVDRCEACWVLEWITTIPSIPSSSPPPFGPSSPSPRTGWSTS